MPAVASPPLLYIAGAYSGDVAKNIERAERVSIDLIRNGFHVITPHKNTAGYEKYEDGRITYGTWLEMDINILSRCDALYVMANWVNSTGAKREVEEARRLGLPVIFESDHPSFELSIKDYIRIRGDEQ